MTDHIKQIVRVWRSPGNQGCRFRALIRAAWWFARTRISNKPVKRSIFSKSSIWCHPNGFGARSLMLFGEWNNYDALKFVQCFLRSGDNFLDIGANVGLFSLLAAEKVGSHTIFCVEPGSTQRSRLVENLALNRLAGATVFPFAVGEEPDTVHFTRNDEVSHITSSDKDISLGTTESVDVRRLDDFLPDHQFQITKLDVEGFELKALRGAKRVIAQGRMPVILFEINGSSERYGIKGSDICNHFKNMGYQLGIYRHDEGKILTSIPLWDDVLAFNAKGADLIKARLPGISIE